MTSACNVCYSCNCSALSGHVDVASLFFCLHLCFINRHARWVALCAADGLLIVRALSTLMHDGLLYALCRMLMLGVKHHSVLISAMVTFLTVVVF
jgi:hypothetical protein